MSGIHDIGGLRVDPRPTERLLEYGAQLAAGERPLPYRKVIEHYFVDMTMQRMMAAEGTDAWNLRHGFICDFSFAIPCAEAIAAFEPSTPILEVGCGSGLWAGALAKAGVDVLATDLYPQSERSYFGQPAGAYAPAYAALDATAAVAAHPDRDLFMCWPDYEDDWAYQAARRLGAGRLIYYIGEGAGGCTGTASLHRFFRNHCDVVGGSIVPKFPGMKDWLSIYRVTK